MGDHLVIHDDGTPYISRDASHNTGGSLFVSPKSRIEEEFKAVNMLAKT